MSVFGKLLPPARALVWSVNNREVGAHASILAARVTKLLGEMDRLQASIGGDVMLPTSKIRRILDGGEP